MAFDIDMIRAVYAAYPERVKSASKVLGGSLTLTEKILYAHLWGKFQAKDFARGVDYVEFAPDRVAMQDATAQMALLQFMQAGRAKVAVPSSVHADHLIQARDEASSDLANAKVINKEVYDFLSSVSNKYGIGFWKPGAGIIHQVVFENYAFPGGMMVGTDSHTVNAGGLGMVAVGVGGADAVDVMAEMPWELKFPKIIGVKLTGKLNGWASAKDIILKLTGILTVKGGTGAIIEYFGEGTGSISATGKGTICNMGAEVGATTSVFAYDAAMERYLRATGRGEVADGANAIADCLKADDDVLKNPEKYYDKVIEIDLSTLEPYLNGPFTPDAATPLSRMREVAREKGYPEKMEVGLIGSCTNSSYEDLSRAASIARQAIEKDIEFKAELKVSPGSEQVRYTVDRDGILDAFKAVGGTVFTNACGPCIGMWYREGADKGEKNTIVHSFNRNFSKRADGNPNTHAFVASPDVVMALSIAGDLGFNPMTDYLTNRKGEKVKLDIPVGDELPFKGFDVKDNGYQAPASDGSSIEVVVDPKSDRLQLLESFPAWDGKNIENAVVLIKVSGKCTTDHISMAGKWLKYRGHLDNISNNCLIGAVNAFNGQADQVKNAMTGQYGSVPAVARQYKAAGVASVVVGDHNYGEGSSREHAAMEPRHLGIRAVIVKSFARIHETNLKKQGMLALTFADEADYDKLREDDRLSFVDLDKFAPDQPLMLLAVHADGSQDSILLRHTYNGQQIGWFRAGAALNLIKNQQ